MWAIIYISAAIVCFIGFFLGGWIGVLAGLGTKGGNLNIFDPLWLFAVFGVFVLPLVILSLSTFLFLKITRKTNIQPLKKTMLAFFWIPPLIIYYLVLLAPSLIIWLIILIAISTVITFVKKLISTGPKA